MRASNIEYFIGELFANLKRNSLMTLATISTATICLCILGGFFLIVINLNKIARDVAGKFEIRVFLKDNLSEIDLMDIERQLLSLNPLVKEVKFISKEQAWEILTKRYKVDLSSLQKNPLPASFVVRVKEPESIPQTAKEIEKIAGVNEVIYGGEVIKKVNALSNIFRFSGSILSGLLILGTLLIIHNTVRLTIFARRREIRIMQLVGATNWFIKVPFILEGIVHGLAGGILACLLLITLYLYLVYKITQSLPFLSLAYDASTLLFLASLLIGSGIVMGLTGSLFTVRKFLRV